ncbi:serine/threonine protein kinase [Saccharothrix coeruleofusca]|uniref:serine/threonine-protein kinase n=1 Tax=Saccharothrix coeruleofusca TaxID=33919 RepID=UPI001AE16BCE|nr:serine/threonine-protein kinase [Saccharothrix coeruleofusca]MBP2335056.1 serine/threonine protein kinase [Saccharothrix coeruleofusca]
MANRYELAEPIGLGGMSEVHRGWDTLLRRHVAIKLFQPGFDDAAAQRFDNEVRALANLSHPWLVSVYDADTHEGTPFVVLQLVEGDTLRDRIERGPLSPDQVRRLGAGLADALAHVHSHGLVHRDIKPSNILLDREDNAYLADFGLVHLTGATRLTRTDQLVGTAAYLAPEQVLGQEVDHPADVYALGLVLLECLTGRREYGGGDVEAAIARLHRPPAIPQHLPADVERLLSRMTASAPHDRPTAQDCARALAAASLLPDDTVPMGTVPTDAAPLGTVPSDTAQAAPRRELRPSRKVLVTVAGALVGALSIGTAATVGQEPATSQPASSTTPPASSAPSQPVAPQLPQDAAPQAVFNPPQKAATQTPDTTQATTTTTTTPQVTTSETPSATTSAPAVTSDPATEVTTSPPVITTTGGQTSTSVPPASSPTDLPESNAGAGEPSPSADERS